MRCGGSKKLSRSRNSSITAEKLAFLLFPSLSFTFLFQIKRESDSIKNNSYLGEAVPGVLVRLAVLRGQAGLGRRHALLRGEDEAAEGQGGDGG